MASKDRKDKDKDKGRKDKKDKKRRKGRKGKEGESPPEDLRLNQKQIDEIAIRIGYDILEKTMYFGKAFDRARGKGTGLLCIASHLCEQGSRNYDCDPTGYTFECSDSEFKCGTHGATFECHSGNWDDFECIKNFDCGSGGGPFKCHNSFDDEDCEGTFNCGEETFVCDSNKEYNT